MQNIYYTIIRFNLKYMKNIDNSTETEIWDNQTYIKYEMLKMNRMWWFYINNCQEVDVVGIGDASSRVALPFIT